MQLCLWVYSLVNLVHATSAERALLASQQKQDFAGLAHKVASLSIHYIPGLEGCLQIIKHLEDIKVELEVLPNPEGTDNLRDVIQRMEVNELHGAFVKMKEVVHEDNIVSTQLILNVVKPKMQAIGDICYNAKHTSTEPLDVYIKALTLARQAPLDFVKMYGSDDEGQMQAAVEMANQRWFSPTDQVHQYSDRSLGVQHAAFRKGIMLKIADTFANLPMNVFPEYVSLFFRRFQEFCEIIRTQPLESRTEALNRKLGELTKAHHAQMNEKGDQHLIMNLLDNILRMANVTI